MTADLSPEDLRDEVAGVLAEHVTEQLWKSGGWAGDTACSCGWRMAMWSRKDFPPVHRKHVADALMPLIAQREAAARAEGYATARKEAADSARGGAQ